MGGWKLQEAFVEIGTKLSGLGKGLDMAKGMVGGAMKGIGAAAQAGLSFAAQGVRLAFEGVIPLLQMGSDLEEMRSKFTAVFQEEEANARAFAESFGQAAGRSQVELETMLSSMQALMAPMGFTRKEARMMSTDLVQLAVDLGSFNNIADDEALLKLRSGLMGEAEPLKSLGIVINDVTLSAKLLQLGLAKNAQEATEQQKIAARMAIIMESTKDAQGDAAKTSDSLANQWKRLTGVLLDLGSELGTALLPAAKGIVTIFNNIAAIFKANQQRIGEVAAQIGDAFQNVFGAVVDAVARLASIWQQAWENFGPVVMSIWSFIGSAVADALGFMLDGFIGLIGWLIQIEGAIFQFAGITVESVDSMASSFSEGWSWIKDAVVSAVGVIKEWVESIIFTFINWDLTARRVGIGMAEMLTNVLGYVQTFATNAAIAVAWFFDNWQDIGFTALDYILTAFVNLGQNIRNIWSAVLDFFKTGKLAFDWTPLLEGAVSTIKKMPEFQPFKDTHAFDDQWKELDDETQKRMKAWQEAMAANTPDVSDDLAKNLQKGLEKTKAPDFQFDVSKFDLSGGKEKKGKAEAGKFSDVAAVWKDITSNILKAKDMTPQKQLDAQKETVSEIKGLRRDMAENEKVTLVGLT